MVSQRRIDEARALHAEGRLEEAAQKYDAILALSPNDGGVLNLQGILAGQRGDYTRSLMLLRRAIEIDPNMPHYRNSIAVTLERVGNHEAAAAAFNDEGNLLLAGNRSAEALAAFGQALRLHPHSPQYRCNYGVALIKLGRCQEAVDILAHTSDENHLAYIPLNLGNAFAGLPQPHEAIAAYDRALTLDPTMVEAHWARGQMLLLLGDYEQGLREYEWRKTWQGFDNPYRTVPEWTGASPQDLNGTLLVVSEQGLGDTIQFSRYVSLLADQGHRIVFDVPDPLYALLREGFVHEAVTIVSRSTMLAQASTDCAAHVLLLSLPYYFATRADTIPASTQYLKISEARIAAQQKRLPDCAHKRIGIVRSGQSLHGGDYARSIPAETIAPLAALNMDFYSLQITKFDCPDVTELGLSFADFVDTAAAIMTMDLVISVDTSVAHLAGMLGKPVWILIPHAPDWRWGLAGETTAWYPTARLFRQENARDWASVIERVRSQLQDLFPFEPTPQQHDDAMPNPVDVLRAQLETDPGNAAVMVAYGTALAQAGEAEAGIKTIERAIGIDPSQPEYYRAMADAHNYGGDALRAAALYAELADVEQRDEVYDDAVTDYASAIALDPGNPDYRNNYGVSLRSAGRLDEALAAFEQALRLVPDHYAALSNRGALYWSLGRHEDAFTDHRAAIAARPDDAQLRLNHAVALREVGRRVEALAEYDRAIELKPDFALAHYDRGQLLAHMGRLKDGFAEMEWRWAKQYNYVEKPCRYKQPVWHGALPEDLAGRLLIVSEQGFGDTIQFSRYAPLLVDCGYHIVLEVQEPLLRLYRESFVRPHLRVIARPAPGQNPNGRSGLFGLGGMPDFSAYVGMLSLPERFMTTLDTVPATTPYLSVRQAHIAKWASRLKAPAAKFKVGLVWQGDPAHVQDKTRSLSPELLHPLLEIPGIDFYALQKGAAAKYRFPYQTITQLGSDLSDFYDTAAVIENLDLVIAVDTAVAHLAGALGCPVWIMLTQLGEWRWMADTDRSPWYPSALLFRQECQGDWRPVIDRIAEELRALINR